jgi:hypothetical protein
MWQNICSCAQQLHSQIIFRKKLRTVYVRINACRCSCQKVSSALTLTHAGCNFACYIRVVVCRSEGRQNENRCSRRREKGGGGRDIMAVFTNCVHRLKLLANCIEQTHLDKFTVAQLVKKVSRFHRTWRCVTLFTTVTPTSHPHTLLPTDPV